MPDRRPTRRADDRPATVLVADDSATVRAVVRLELEAAGYAVLEAADGVQAVRTARAEDVDVVLLDVEMPELDGWQVLEQLTDDPATAGTPVVFLTGRTSTDDLVRALDRGAHDFVRKPPEPAELLARVASAARVKDLQDQLRTRAAELDQQGRTDVLTGLHNRRHAEEHLLARASYARRHAEPLVALLVDVDHFKAVNDTLGHAAGDVVLRAVAACLRETARAEDLVARWGGEEFLVVPAPPPGGDAGALMAERLRRAVAAAGPEVDGRPVPVTVSLGVAVVQAVPDERDENVVQRLLVLADDALYAAKDAGRNCVVTAPAPAV